MAINSGNQRQRRRLSRLAVATMASAAILAFSAPVIAQEPASAWPAMPKTPKGAPNILVIMTDDVGFASSSTFGGPSPTPTFDALAKQGLRYNNFNTTALCSPTRAALLTGRNPHNVEMGTLTNTPTGYDGYTTSIPKSAGTVARTLQLNGYATAVFGKWHLAPEWEMSRAGPFEHWPTHMGFDHFYGFLEGSTDQWAPTLNEDTHPIEPPYGDPTYILDKDLADRTIAWIREQKEIAPSRPFFVYYATGTAHSPHQAPADWIAKFHGRFDQGWDKLRAETFARQKALGVIPADARLTPRPKSLPAWSSLSPERKKIAARLMEAYAAALSYGDAQIGRVIEDLRQSGELDNTLVVYIQGDNGSSAEGGIDGLMYEESFVHGFKESMGYMLRHLNDVGGPMLANHYPAGWAWAMNSPFQYYKQVASHFGGTRNGLVISWPKGIQDRGGIRNQFHFVADIAPTLLEAAHISTPQMVDGVQQLPLDGVSMNYSFDHPNEASHRTTQVFEMVQNLGIYHDGWWAGTTPFKAPWDMLKPGSASPANQRWELYHVAEDFSQSRDLAKREPKKLAEMQSLFRQQAQDNHILPIHASSDGAAGRPSWDVGRKSFDFYPGLTRLPENNAPATIGHSFTITADVTLDDDSGHGVMIAHGGRFGGYAFYMKDGKLVFHYNAVGERQSRITSSAVVPAGQHGLKMTFTADEPKRGTAGAVALFVDGNMVGQGRVEQTLVTWISHTEGLDIGKDTITPVSEDYAPATSAFSGKITRVRVELQ